MTRLVIIVSLIVLALAVSCGTQQSALETEVINLVPIHGYSGAGLSWKHVDRTISLSFKPIAREGCFVQIALPDGTCIVSEKWENDAGTLHLLVHTDEGAELGLVPLEEPHDGLITALLQLSTNSRITNTPPLGSESAVKDLRVTELDSERISLEWTEVNTGDYDLNGEVNIADLTPLGSSLGITSHDPQWVEVRAADGDGNGEINVADVTPIGQHFNTSISGYFIARGGVALPDDTGQALKIPHDSGTRDRGRWVYRVEIDGTPGSDWSVAPVDNQNTVGQESTEPDVEWLDLRATLNISGADLMSFEGGDSGSFDSGYYLMRVIIDYDWPSIWDPGIGDSYDGPVGVMYFNNIPRDQLLYLDILYAPAVDLASGEMKGSSALRLASDVAEADVVITRIPFSIPSGLEQGEIEADITLEPVDPENLVLGYYVTLEADRRLATTSFVRSRVEYRRGLVCADTDYNGSYDDEVQLQDSNLDGIGDRRLEMEADELAYAGGQRGEVVIRGKVDAFNESEGYLILTNAELLFGDGPWPSGAPLFFDPTFFFSELVNFEHESGLPDFDPSSLSTGQRVTVNGFWLNDSDAGLPIKYWANSVFVLNP